MQIRDLALAIRDALECGNVETFREVGGDLEAMGAIYIDSVDVSDVANVMLVTETGEQFFLHIVRGLS
jgi:hypothetical protein